MKTFEELAEISRGENDVKATGQKTIAVGMATCGIAAGARPVMNSFANELRTRGLKNVKLTMTGCIGMCNLEPIVEVIDEDGTRTIYIKVTAEKAAQIVKDHIIGGRICKEFTAN